VNGSRGVRLLKFSVVGALGIIVQFAMLAALNASHVHYLEATAFAVETAVIHNFFWHRFYTWRDRRHTSGSNFLRSLLRFHISNGLMSLVGNLICMRLLVGRLGMPLLSANAASISICFFANFLASDRWVFRS
jgi:putative flippase GtrA